MKTKQFSISVGLPVYLEPTGNAAYSRNAELIPGTISKIGRKYFYVTSERRLWGGEAKFDRETFICWDSNENYGYKIYLHPEWYEWEQERIKKLAEIKDQLSRMGDDIPYGVICKMHATLKSWMEAEKGSE